ncbi:hypothetical protein F1880_001441 [Penicillium rolfsii]|nr:hypothetical protein F1880_001441 [Penicillium rolfsii]
MQSLRKDAEWRIEWIRGSSGGPSATDPTLIARPGRLLSLFVKLSNKMRYVFNINVLCHGRSGSSTR